MAPLDKIFFNNQTTLVSGKTPTTAGVSASVALGALPLVSDKKEEEKGLTVQKSAAPTGPSFDTQVKKWFGLSDEKWNALSEEEKQKKSDIALKGMIDAYNANQKKLGTDKKMTVAEQYGLYIGRCKTEEEVIRLTRTVKAMDKDNQLEAFKSSYKYQNEGFRDVAESILANDYTQLHRDNVVEAARETENFSPKNQVIAAQNASQADVSTQVALVETFMERENEDIDAALAKQIGDFGVKQDGTMDAAGIEAQKECFDILNTSQFKDLVESILATDYVKLHPENVIKAARETEHFSHENQVIAAQNASNADVSTHVTLVKIFMESKSEDIDGALASQISKFGVKEDGTIDEAGLKTQLECLIELDESQFHDAVGQFIASDYVKSHPQVLIVAIKLLKGYSIKIQVMAAKNASNTPVDMHEAVTGAFMGFDNKDVDMALSDQAGDFGRNQDGTIDDTGRKIQLDCYEKLSTSPFQEVIENLGGNIWRLDAQNQAPATQIIVNTGNQAAVDAAAKQFANYDSSAKEEIKNIINNSNYESAKIYLVQVEAEEAKETLEAEEDVEPNSTNRHATSAEVEIQKTEEIIKSGNPSPAALKQEIGQLSELGMIALLKKYPNNISIIKAVMQNNPSLTVLSQISVNMEDEKTIDFKTMMPQLCFLNARMQNSIVKQSAQTGNLGDINRKYLNASVKDEYDKFEEDKKNKQEIC